MIMRPDEIAGRSEIERDQRFRGNVAKGIGTAATAVAGIGSAAAASRILPWLNKFIPADLAMKGLDKVSPKLADFLKRGQSAGLNVEEGIQYLRDSLAPKQQAEPAKQNGNIIEQYSPELHQFIIGEIQSGRSPLEAGALAILNRKGMPNFKSIIDKITKDHKTPWSAILETVYGSQNGSQKGEQKSPNQPQQQQSEGEIHPDLAKLIQQGGEILKKFRGE